MRAALLQEFGRPLVVSEVPEPNAGRGELIVRVRAVGLCATDLKLVSGVLEGVRLPLIPGHEVAGEIADDPDGRRPRGERVACYLYEPCGRCGLCARGLGTLCRTLVRLGIERDGGLGEYVAVPRENALPVGAWVPFEAAAVAMDSVLTPWRALRGRARVGDGEMVAVVGAGGLGLNGVQIALDAGAHVAAVDPDPASREEAANLGAELCVDPSEAERLREWSGDGVDVALDTSGSADGFETALAALRPGGRLVGCGYQPGVRFGFESSRLPLDEVTILGARVGSRDDAKDSLAAVGGGRVRPAVSQVVGLDAVNEALQRLRSGAVVGRLAVDPGA